MTATGINGSTRLRFLQQALAVFGRVLDGVTPADAGRPTPCTEWTVQDLVDHVLNGNRRFAEWIATGSFDPAADIVHREWRAAYQASCAAIVAAATPETLDRPLAMPFGEPVTVGFALGMRVVDLLSHGWDLARATGQPISIDDALGAYALETAHEFFGPARQLPGFPVEPEVPISSDAPWIDRLAAYAGRNPAEWAGTLASPRPM